MEFTIVCPIDGSIQVGLEDIDNVVLRDSDRADITFLCPHCGAEISVTAIVPAFLLAAMKALADEPDAIAVSGVFVVSSEAVDEDAASADRSPRLVMSDDDPRLRAYCEYFHRQLEDVATVEDVLEQIGDDR